MAATGCTMDLAKVAQMVEGLNWLTARDVLCLYCDRMYEGRPSSEDPNWQGKAIKS
jgi:hypothetical protein